MRGLSNLVDYLLQDSRNLFFGVSDIAYANTGFSYTTNMRQFLGWQSSVEMAYVNILIKNGLIGYDDQTMKIEFNCEDVIRRALEKYGA